MSEPGAGWPVDVEALQSGEVTAADLLLVLGRIADALEKPQMCLVQEEGTEWVCALPDRHKGRHAATDGEQIHRWLDD